MSDEEKNGVIRKVQTLIFLPILGKIIFRFLGKSKFRLTIIGAIIYFLIFFNISDVNEEIITSLDIPSKKFKISAYYITRLSKN